MARRLPCPFPPPRHLIINGLISVSSIPIDAIASRMRGKLEECGVRSVK
jgi:hypothetical protein